MSTNSELRSCLVTGGTSGIGSAAVEMFCEQGYRVATCGRDTNRLNDLINGKLSDQDQHLVAQVDLEEVDQARMFARDAIDKFQGVDVLVNNAAVAPLAAFDAIESDTFEQTLNINIRSTFYLTQLIWRQMIEQGRGVVINISSLAAVAPFPGFSIYGASKAWMDLMTTALAAEGSENGIRVYSIRCGAVETPMLRGLFPDFPADQCVSTQDVAKAILACVNEEHESGSYTVVANQE